MDNLDIDLRDAAENLLIYKPTVAAVLLPIKTGRPVNGPEFVVAGTVADIRKILGTIK